ncbi:unnamed protein product [Linum trigynum]|uniref:Reverse transcriptase Ty1/copia-type domain-containing protein n=1 Tax=Linum trigynum TaxID=586398 RepID=A0AAV2DCW8_9ROSI
MSSSASSDSISATGSSSSTVGVAPPSSPLVPPVRCSNQGNLGVPPPFFNDYFSFQVAPIFIPTRYSLAQGDPRWDAAMTEEILALHVNHTWDIVPRPPPEIPVVGIKWVYNIKVRPDGSLECFKALVVVQGFTQKYGIDFEDTFAPIAKMVLTIRRQRLSTTTSDGCQNQQKIHISRSQLANSRGRHRV